MQRYQIMIQLQILNPKKIRNGSLEQKILFLVSLETRQNRYRTQVVTPLVDEEQSNMIKKRLKTYLNADDNVQVGCQIDFSDCENGEAKFSAQGLADVVKDGVVYELKFVSELTHEHFLQCASYMVALNLPKGILWNTRDNTSYEIEVPDRKAFLDAVAKAVTKGMIENYYEPARKSLGLHKEFVKKSSEKRMAENAMDKFAVIDTETNWNNEVMLIGVVVADSGTKEEIDSVYYIIDPEYREGGMYANRLDGEVACVTSRKQALKEIKEWLDTHNVKKLFAYNAIFDKGHLPEYSEFEWYDIMYLASRRQYNSAIPDSADCYKSGKMKRGYGAENILKMLSKDEGYSETHNAVLDARDELKIIQLLGHEIKEYDVALISNKKASFAKPQQNKAKTIHEEQEAKAEYPKEEVSEISETEKKHCGTQCTIVEEHGDGNIAIRFEDGTLRSRTFRKICFGGIFHKRLILL